MKGEKKGLFEYDPRPDLGIHRGSDSSYFVPTEFAVVKTMEAFEAGVSVVQAVREKAANIAGKAKSNQHGAVNVENTTYGDVYP